MIIPSCYCLQAWIVHFWQIAWRNVYLQAISNRRNGWRNVATSPWNTVVENVIIAYAFKNLSHFCTSLPCSYHPIPNQIYPCNILIYVCKNYFNIILSSMSRPVPFGYPDYNFVCILHISHACHIVCPCHLPWCDRFSSSLWSKWTM